MLMTTIRRMSAQADFAAYCTELLAPAGEVRSKRMFGGYGLYVDDVFVAIVAGDALYLKADEQTRHRFEAAGGRRFEYTRQGRQQSLAFWTAPAEAMDSPALMRPWVQLALDAALRARGSRRRTGGSMRIR
jgi:DNA transformation protein and related proteins